MSISYTYFGHTTLTRILVGDGRGAWSRWGPMDHEGPRFRLDYLGYPFERYAYLPQDMLTLLYERFQRANPDGVTFTGGDLFEHNFLASRYSNEEQATLYDQRKALFDIDDEGWQGYPYMRPYLPELFDAAVIEKLAADPWLDPSLLGYAEHLGAEKGIPPDLWVDRSSRWSPEWRTFCDRLTPDHWTPETGWRLGK